jgi:hypothetical protein
MRDQKTAQRHRRHLPGVRGTYQHALATTDGGVFNHGESEPSSNRFDSEMPTVPAYEGCQFADRCAIGFLPPSALAQSPHSLP